MSKQDCVFNIRVYGLLFNKMKQLLLTDEYRLNIYMTKFPGGGLEPGEGTIDCLKRECMEELGQEPAQIKHFYTTDFYQPTQYLNQKQQLISIYYTGVLQEPYTFATTNKVFNFPQVEGMQSFRWTDVMQLKQKDLTMPIDKIVLEQLKSTIKQ